MFLYKYTFARSSKVIEIDSTNQIANTYSYNKIKFLSLLSLGIFLITSLYNTHVIHYNLHTLQPMSFLKTLVLWPCWFDNANCTYELGNRISITFGKCDKWQFRTFARNKSYNRFVCNSYSMKAAINHCQQYSWQDLCWITRVSKEYNCC